MIVYCEIISK